MWDGFCAVEVLPSPKSHDHDVADPVDSSVKSTVKGATPEVGVPLKSAFGPPPPPPASTVIVVVAWNFFLFWSSIFPFQVHEVELEGKPARS